MASYFHPHHGGLSSRNSLMLVLLLILVSILSAWGASSSTVYT